MTDRAILFSCLCCIIGGTIKTIQEKNKVPTPSHDPRFPTPKGQTVGSFRKGPMMLPDAIAKSWRYGLYGRLGSNVKLLWRLSAISNLDNGVYELTYDTPEGVVSLKTRSVVLTIPSYLANNLFRPLSVTDALTKFYYPPVAAVTISYPKEAIRRECLIDGELKGFGQLHPRSQGVETIGTIHSSSLFPNRAPAGRVFAFELHWGSHQHWNHQQDIRSASGSSGQGSKEDAHKPLCSRPSSFEVLHSYKPPLVLGVRVWPQAIPQFLVGHLDLLDATRSALKDIGFHGIFLGGNYVSGVALGRCVEGAYEVAAEVSNFLSRYAYK
ncbi:hypothetical protein MLD38_015739 [Melastoma candidum]|uniref:Uncharacterized protein n=1 Tax=Melastoma candidum TaxID=119954 RepID=A0ACB9RHP9_9MYRT|nr:hypothetical protein MLD38_015739 [Melastoma candidum]